MSHGGVNSPVRKIILVGHEAALYENVLQNIVFNAEVTVELGNIWQNALDIEKHMPPVSKEESLEYATSAGLALIS